jgi:hypothetical protein
MPMQEQALRKRRLQILDDKTRDEPRFNPHENEDAWLSSFMARFLALVRKIGGKN